MILQVATHALPQNQFTYLYILVHLKTHIFNFYIRFDCQTVVLVFSLNSGCVVWFVDVVRKAKLFKNVCIPISITVYQKTYSFDYVYHCDQTFNIITFCILLN